MAKAWVCKTHIRGFDSRPDLKNKIVAIDFVFGREANGKGVGETGVSPCRKALKTERFSKNLLQQILFDSRPDLG